MAYRCKDYQTGHLFATCEGCNDMTCLASGEPCAEIEAVLKCVTHTRRQAFPQLWGTPRDMERHAMRKDGMGSAIVQKF